jgi:hypothetical protein
MRTGSHRRWVLVAHRAGLAQLLDPAAPRTPAQARLVQLLDGQSVLVYGDSPTEQRRFARALRHRLNATARTR